MPSGPRVTPIQSRAISPASSAKVRVTTTKAWRVVRVMTMPMTIDSSRLTSPAKATPTQKAGSEKRPPPPCAHVATI